MRLPVPGPSDLLVVLGKGADQVDALLGAIPRAIVVLDAAEVLLVRASAAIDQVEEVTAQAAGVVARSSAVVDRAEAQVDRLNPLLDGLEAPLTTLQPTLEALADTTHPEEVAALVSLIDHLPELTARVENDVLPVMATLGSVAPDLHDLLAVSRELNDMLAKLPGLGRIKRRIDEQQGEDGTTAPVRG
jgi:ABC-type transporter Mla subunit MlaD